MKKIFLPVVAATALLFTACGAEVTTEDNTDTTDEVAEETAEPVAATYTVDAAATTLEWKGFEEGAEETHYHSGTAPVSGTIETLDGAITGGTFTIAMDQLAYNVGVAHGSDIDSENEMAGNLLSHFMDSTFFNNSAMTTATFTINGCDENGVNGTLNVVGNDVDVLIPGSPLVSETSVTHSAEFALDLSTAVPYLSQGGTGISMKLNLTANK